MDRGQLFSKFLKRGRAYGSKRASSLQRIGLIYFMVLNQ